MAFKKCFNEICGTVLVLSALLSSASAVDCHGKSFHCVNTTHFMICVDLGGGVSHSIDNFLIPCPPPTVCQRTNHFECEFHAPTTPIATLTNVIIETTQQWEDVVVTTNSPQKKSTKEYSEKYINTESLMSSADSFTKDATFDYTTEVAPSSLTDVNSQTDSIFYDTTIIPAITESTFNDTATGWEQVTEIIVENIVTGVTEVITDIPLIKTTIAEPNNTKVNTETTGITTISSDGNLNLPLSRENSTTTDTTSGGVLDYAGVHVLRTDSNLNAEQTDGYTTVVNIVTTEQSELTTADVVQRSEYTIISEQITTTDSTFDTKNVNTDQPQISILPTMIADATTNLATPRQSSLPDDLQNVFDQSPTTIDTVFSYDSVTYKQDVNEVGSTTDASNFTQKGVTEQSTSNSNDIYTTEIPFTAATNDQIQLLLTDDEYFITESSISYNTETSWSAGNVSTTNNTQKETNEIMNNHGEEFTHKTGLINYSIGEKNPKATVDYPIKKNINAKSDSKTIIYDTQLLQATVTTEQPVTLADSFQIVANELLLTDSSLISVTNDPVILNFKGDEAFKTEKIPVIKDDTTLNIEKNTQNENIQDRANASGYVNKVVPEQPNTNTFENTVTTEITVDLPITTSIVTTSEISDTISRTFGSTEQPITITFEEKYQTVGNNIYITEPSTIFTTNNQEPQQLNSENTVIEANSMLVNRNNSTPDAKHNSSIKNANQIFNQGKLVSTAETRNINDTTVIVKLETNTFNNEPNNLPTEHSTTIENIMQTETPTENTSAISDITTTPATDPVPITIEVVTEESNINKSQGIFASQREEINVIDTPKGVETVTTYNSMKKIENPVSVLNANIVQSVVNEKNTEGKLLADRMNDNAFIANTTVSTTIPNNLKQNTMSSGSDTNTNKNGNIITPSALSSTDQNDSIQAILPHETDTIPSVNQSIVTSSAPSTTDANDSKQNTVSSGSDTNENGNIATPSALLITDLNDFIQTTLPHGTDTSPSLNENFLTTLDPSTTDPNVSKQNTVSREIDTNNNVNGIIVTNSAMSITDPSDLKRNILENETDIITSVIENIVTTSAPSIAGLKDFTQNNAPHGTIALSEQQMLGKNIETKMMNENNFKTAFTSKLEDQTIGNTLISTTNLNEVEGSTHKPSDSKLNDHKDVNHFIKSNSGRTIATQLENLAPSNEISLTEENISSITEDSQGITDTTTGPSIQIIQYVNSLSISKPVAIDVTNNKYQNYYIHINKPAPNVEKDVHGTTVSFTSTINRIKGDEDLINQNNKVTTEYAYNKWTGMPTSSGVITETNNLISNRMENNAFVQFNTTSEPSTEPGVVINDAFNDKTFTTSEPPSPVPTKDTKTKSTILENVQTVRYTIANFFNTASENSTQGARADSNSDIQSGTEFEISSKPTVGNNNIKTESDPSIIRPSINIINVTKSSSTIKWETTEAQVSDHKMDDKNKNQPSLTGSNLAPSIEYIEPNTTVGVEVNNVGKIGSETSAASNIVNEDKIMTAVEPTNTEVIHAQTNKISSGVDITNEPNLIFSYISEINKTTTSNPVRSISSTMNSEHNAINDSDFVLKKSSTTQSKDINVEKAGIIVSQSNNLKETASHHKTASGETSQNKISMSDVQPQTRFSIAKETNNILQHTGTTFSLSRNSVNADITQTDLTRTVSGQIQDTKQSVQETNNLGTLNLASNSNVINELKNQSPITVTTSSINHQSDLTIIEDGNDVAHSKFTLVSKSDGKSTDEAQSAISQNNTSKLTSTTTPNLGNSSTGIKRTSASQTAGINDSSLFILQNSTNSVTAHDSKLQQSAQSTQSVVVTKKTVPKVINPVTITQTSTERIIQKIVSPVIENPKKQVTNNIIRNYTCINGIRGRHSDKDDCRKFYICVGNTEPIVGHCPLNTVFSDIKKLCTKNMSHCIRENEFKCPSDGRFSDVAKENVYYICVSHKNHLYRFKFQCQSGFTLNKTTVRCVENKEIESNESVSISISESADDSSSNKISSGTSSGSTRSGSTSSSSSGSNISSFGSDSDSSSSKSKINKEKPESKDEEDDEEVFECEKTGKFPVRNDCTRYYLCKKNRKSQFRRKLKRCESGDVFHKSKKRCVDADSYEC